MLETLGFGIIIIIAFLASFLLTKFWIRAAERINLVGKDMNKKSGMVAEAGGMPVVLSLTFATLLVILFGTFFIGIGQNTVLLFALLSSVMLACTLGFIDDILGWKVGLRQSHKFLLTLPIALPPMVISAGVSSMTIPLFGSIEFGIFYPLVLIPIGVIGATNGFNLLAGLNSLETSMGSIILFVLGVVSLTTSNIWMASVAFIAVASLLGFFVFNKYPAKIFPGDTLTYSIGALIALIAILGNMEKIAVILFIPFIIEFLLKARSKFKAESFGKLQKDGTLKPLYKKNYSLTHVVMRYMPKIFGRNLKETEVVETLILFELILVVISLLL